MDVYGVMDGCEILLFTGDTTIIVKSGEDTTYNVILGYVGPVTYLGAVTMVVTLGNIGTATINGVIAGTLDSLPRYTLTMTTACCACGNLYPSGERTVIHGIPNTIVAVPCSGNSICGWQVVNGEATVEDPLATATSIILSNGDATVRGVFCTGTCGSNQYLTGVIPIIR